MNREQLLQEFYQGTVHNLNCYSADNQMTMPKKQYEEEWHTEQEKLQIIKELMEEEKTKDFHLYTSMYNINNNREKRTDIDLARIVDRKNGISCSLVLREDVDNKELGYWILNQIHMKKAFDEEFEKVYYQSVDKEVLKDREILKHEMQNKLEFFKEFIEIDKRRERFFEKFYKDEETEEFE